MPGGDAMFGSASQRMPRLTVRLLRRAPVVAEPQRVGRPRHVDRPVALREVDVGVGHERVQQAHVPLRRDRARMPAGNAAFRIAADGAVEKLKKPARWMYQGPPSCTWMYSPPIFRSCLSLCQLRSTRPVQLSCFSVCG